MLPRDHAARTAALDPHRSLLVQAPAGSGKTELLTDRILALLSTVAQPDEIVAITFTRKAAGEMHSRVMQKLRAGLAPCPDAPHERRSWELARAALEHDRQQGWQLLEFPARLTIQTIDAFCASLVQRMPYLSRLGGSARITESPHELYLQAARETLALADDSDHGTPVRRLLAHLDVNPRRAAELLAGMLSSRDQWLPLLAGTGERAWLEHNLRDAVAHELRQLIDAMPLGWQHELPPLARAACEFLADNPDHPLQPLARWCDGHTLSHDINDLSQWRALAHLLLTSSDKPRLRSRLTRDLGFPPGSKHKAAMEEWLRAAAGDTAWVELLAQVRTLPNGEYSPEQWEALTALFHCLRLAVAQLQLTFAAAGEIDFIEVTQRALAALGSADDPSELLLRLDRRIRHLLIDEFQDTSQSQIELLQRLTAGWEPGDGRTLFVVGDPMQSIYRFRKAEVSLFLDAATHGIGNTVLHALQLSVNFRSQAGIVDWVNETFSKVFPPRHDPDLGAIAYARSDAFNPPRDGPPVQFHPVWRRDGDSAPLDETEEDIVVRLVRAALAGDRPDDQPDVAILVRARTHVQAIAHRLSTEGIAYQAIELTRLAERPVVADLVQLARALAHPGDRLAWLCVLRAPWCGASLRTLHQLAGEDHHATIPDLLRTRLPQVTDPSERLRLEHVLQALWGRAPVAISPDNETLWRVPSYHDAAAIPFAAWVEQVWQRLGGPLAFPGKRNATDAESFFRLLEEQAPYGRLDPARLTEALQELFAAPDPGRDASRVQIMTMHKSKGLQFDTVILPGLHRRPRREDERLVRFEYAGGRLLVGPIKPHDKAEPDPISRFLAQREARRGAYESDRLLYVAATRARRHLHLVGEVCFDGASGEIRPPASTSLLSRLWPMIERDLSPPSTDAPLPADPAASAACEGGHGGGANGTGAPEPARNEAAESVAGVRTATVTSGAAAPPLQRLRLDVITALRAHPTEPEYEKTPPDTPSWDVDRVMQGESVHPGLTATTWPPAQDTIAADIEGAGDAVPPLPPDNTSSHFTLTRHATLERVIGRVAHAWLEYIGRHGPDDWTPLKVTESGARIRTQLLRSGLDGAQADAAVEVVLDTLSATLTDERGRWLMQQAAKREWRLLNREGRQVIVDLAIEQDDAWLVVDYKTQARPEDMDMSEFARKMLALYRPQLAAYCSTITAATGKPASAVLYLPRARLWLPVSDANVVELSGKV